MISEKRLVNAESCVMLTGIWAITSHLSTRGRLNAFPLPSFTVNKPTNKKLYVYSQIKNTPDVFQIISYKYLINNNLKKNPTQIADKEHYRGFSIFH